MSCRNQIRIYVAGRYSADNVISVLDNMRDGMRLATEVLLAGYSPFVPWFDHHFQLMLRDNEKLTVEHYYNYCFPWLEVSQGVIVVPNSENSKGTREELRIASELNIPIFDSIEDMNIYFNKM